eukprot:TRINITY_DN17328_c0_g1_i1.p1 TRINITY_DN17328_c0_g1~~TRINITY_DN17328_c0_g1_i1.p1  ORF type:complete len:116 (-),score=15.68 TRINITY_DN17328_c0_g1_i1:25-372(-)
MALLLKFMRDYDLSPSSTFLARLTRFLVDEAGMEIGLKFFEVLTTRQWVRGPVFDSLISACLSVYPEMLPQAVALMEQASSMGLETEIHPDIIERLRVLCEYHDLKERVRQNSNK